MRNKIFRGFCIVLAICMMITSLMIFAQPKINEIQQEQHAEEEILDFFETYWGGIDPRKQVEENSANSSDTIVNTHRLVWFPDLLADMQTYNKEIYENGQIGISDPWAYQVSAMDLSKYGLTDKPIGILTIPKLDFQQPIYVGATSKHLDDGVAQLAISSMPIGGINTNSVIAGHRGWRGAPYLRYIDKLEIGDTIFITNFWEEMTYRVVEIQIIEPHEADKILIQPGRDLITIMTCHPYGTGGRYRMLVFCEREASATAILSAATAE